MSCLCVNKLFWPLLFLHVSSAAPLIFSRLWFLRMNFLRIPFVFLPKMETFWREKACSVEERIYLSFFFIYSLPFPSPCTFHYLSCPLSSPVLVQFLIVFRHTEICTAFWFSFPHTTVQPFLYRFSSLLATPPHTHCNEQQLKWLCQHPRRRILHSDA